MLQQVGDLVDCFDDNAKKLPAHPQVRPRGVWRSLLGTLYIAQIWVIIGPDLGNVKITVRPVAAEPPCCDLPKLMVTGFPIL